MALTDQGVEGGLDALLGGFDQGLTAELSVVTGDRRVTVDAVPAAGKPASTPGPTATETVNGLTVTLTVSDADSTNPNPLSGAAAYFPNVTSFGTDQENWTTSVVVP